MTALRAVMRLLSSLFLRLREGRAVPCWGLLICIYVSSDKTETLLVVKYILDAIEALEKWEIVTEYVVRHERVVRAEWRARTEALVLFCFVLI